jgi:hypothetical protein
MYLAHCVRTVYLLVLLALLEDSKRAPVFLHLFQAQKQSLLWHDPVVKPELIFLDCGLPVFRLAAPVCLQALT